MIDKDAMKVVEAVLFSTPDVLSSKQIADVLGNDFPTQKVRSLVDLLNEEYQSTDRTFRIQRVAEGFQMRTLPMYKTWLTRLEPLKPLRLSQAAMETLAIVAYRQPVIRADIDYLRGVDSSHNLRSLLEKKLIHIAGKDTGPGRPILYTTTKKFLGLFSLNDLKDLPTVEELNLPGPNPRPQQLPLEAAG
ncbi:MAG: SMC-Scp complex subunit ScpB [Deltaproteobacteria bacterium]|nr:SMC-Scp complex subunit ScpB [Deltaproteobacteria bacterium]